MKLLMNKLLMRLFDKIKKNGIKKKEEILFFSFITQPNKPNKIQTVVIRENSSKICNKEVFKSIVMIS